MSNAQEKKVVIYGIVSSDASDAEFIKYHRININEARQQLRDDPTKRYLRIKNISDYMKWLRTNAIDKNASIEQERAKTQNMNKTKIAYRLEANLYQILYNYSWYGSHTTDKNNRAKIRGKVPDRFRKLKTNNKLNYIYDTGTYQNIIDMDKYIAECKKYEGLKIIQQIVIPQYEEIFKIIISKLYKIKDINKLNIKNISELLTFISKTENIKNPFTDEAKQLLNIRQEYIDLLKEYYIKTNDLSGINNYRIKKFFTNKTKNTDIRKFKPIILSKYRDLSRLKNIKNIASIFNSKKVNADIGRLSILKVSDVASFKSEIKDSLIDVLEKLINDTKRKTNLRILSPENINKFNSDLSSLYKSTNILLSRDRKNLKNKILNISLDIKKKTREESKENKKQKFEAYLERIKNTSNNINLKSIKNEFGDKSPYFIKLQTALRTRKTKTGNIPFKIYNQIKNEQIKKFKKDGNPYPLNYFKTRYGYTNEQLKILKSNYVNKLEDEYKEIDLKYIDELNRIQRQYYAGLINALRKLLSGNVKQSYSVMARNASKNRHEKIQALNKEHSSKFSTELKKRRTSEMNTLAKHFKSYHNQLKKALRTTKRKLLAKKRASRKK